jgi:hypothetical protein
MPVGCTRLCNWQPRSAWLPGLAWFCTRPTLLAGSILFSFFQCLHSVICIHCMSSFQESTWHLRFLHYLINNPSSINFFIEFIYTQCFYSVLSRLSKNIWIFIFLNLLIYLLLFQVIPTGLYCGYRPRRAQCASNSIVYHTVLHYNLDNMLWTVHHSIPAQCSSTLLQHSALAHCSRTVL